jgi:hypothetical protein
MVPRVLAKGVQQGGGPAGTATKRLEQVREPRFQVFSKLGCVPELRNGLQFVERGSECIRETPDCPPPLELLVLWLVVR